MVNELYHYGTPRHSGRYPWGSGKRPYQSAVSRAKAAAKTRDKVESIVNSLSMNEKIKLGMDPKDPQYLTIQEGEHVIHRTLKEVGDVPVSFFDLLDDGDTINLAFATRAGDNYRGKGYGTEAAKQAMQWLDKHPEAQKGRDIIWGVKVDNEASIAVAKKLGFVIDESSLNDGWINYVKKSNKNLTSDIYSKAKSIEPKITMDVTDAAKATSGKMYGLEHRLKTKDSIARKIDTDSKEKGITLQDAASSLKDAVRYTLVSNDDDFVKNYNIFKKQLQNNNYEETRCKNYFEMYNQGLVKHKSVQSQFKDPSGYSFEVQFQTPSSQNAKDKKIPLYEEARSLGVSNKRKAELEKMMVELAERVTTPKNISRIKSH